MGGFTRKSVEMSRSNQPPRFLVQNSQLLQRKIPILDGGNTMKKIPFNLSSTQFYDGDIQ